MPKITFIRHAEKDGEGYEAGLTEAGAIAAHALKGPESKYVFCSFLSRSFETALLMYPKATLDKCRFLNEYDKASESWPEFIDRVEKSLPILARMDGDCVVIGHGRWMNVAYQLLKKDIVVGFDHLGSFEHEF